MIEQRSWATLGKTQCYLTYHSLSPHGTQVAPNSISVVSDQTNSVPNSKLQPCRRGHWPPQSGNRSFMNLNTDLRLAFRLFTRQGPGADLLAAACRRYARRKSIRW